LIQFRGETGHTASKKLPFLSQAGKLHDFLREFVMLAAESSDNRACNVILKWS
jgi:hypothetical protein